MKQLLRFCESQSAWLRQVLDALVSIESPTGDTGAVDRCGAAVAAHLAELGADVRTVQGATAASHLLASFDVTPVPDAPGRRPVLILGHVDTVWPVGSLREMPIREHDGRLYGPGVFDMKGGIVIALLALRALRARAADDPAWSGPGAIPPISVLFTSDEETGSAGSRPLIEHHARLAEAVLVLEPSLPGGGLKTARKGCGEFVVRATGRAAHAGIEPEKGASAILELCDQLLLLDRAQDRSAGTTLSAGTIRGGTRANVVPAEAEAVVDVRVSTATEAGRIEELMRRLAPRRPGTRVEAVGGFDRPPFERTAEVVRLLELARRVGAEIGLDVTDGATGGASDGNITAALGVPTLDGLGAIGDGAHAADEYVRLDALPARAALLAGLICRLGHPVGHRRG